MKAKDTLYEGAKGFLTLEIVNRLTGEVVDRHSDSNVLVIDSKQAMARSIAGNQLGVITDLKIGDDIGSGTLDNPEAPNDGYDETTMDVVYEFPGDLVVGYPNSSSVNFSATISGEDVMDNYPNEVSIVFTSAALHTNSGDVFSYKRFEQKSISELLDISIVWEIQFD